MNKTKYLLLIINLLIIVLCNKVYSQNPLIMDQFTADPTARVFEGKLYVYPSHDILAKENRGRVGWFCMEDYHVFSSDNLTDWEDHGVIVKQTSVPWVNDKAYAMWAPDCISKNGKYYFYFPSPAKDTTLGRGFSIGVAIADKPYGPFIPQPDPIKNVRGIDPNVFIDSDGQAYIYWSARNFYVAKLNENMTELASEPMVIDNLPTKGLKEGPFMFERNGVYYLTYPHVENNTERLEYATGDNPMGPFEIKGVIMDESPECWTNHQSIVEFDNQWYLFYHFNDLSPNFDKNRSIRADSLFFNDDGTIQKVIPTLRGVGISDAGKKIQIDRHSAVSEKGVSIEFLDTLNRFDGWKVNLLEEESWVQYNSVEFKSKKLEKMIVCASAPEGGNLEIRLDNPNGKLLLEVKISENNNWKNVEADLEKVPSGIHNIVIVNKGKPISLDWIKFE